jgi:hypothetical protein
MPQRPINRAKAGLTRRCSLALAFMPGRAFGIRKQFLAAMGDDSDEINHPWFK